MINILQNILNMFSVMLLVLSANELGFFDRFMVFFNRFKSERAVLSLWFFLTVFVTALIPDTITATIMIPIGLIYAEKVNISKQKLLLTIAFACVSGNDLTYMGGGDNLLAFSFLESYLQQPINYFVWARKFIVPTILEVCISFTILNVFIFKKQSVSDVVSAKKKYSTKEVLFLILIGVGLLSAFDKSFYVVTYSIAFVSVFLDGYKRDALKKLPYRAILIWTLAILFGNLVWGYVSNLNLSYVMNIDSIKDITMLLTILGVISNFTTNTALTSIITPLSLAIDSSDTLLLFTMTVKAINLSYLTVWSNGCMAVSVGYGLNPKYLFKYGIIIFITNIAVLSVYFCMML